MRRSAQARVQRQRSWCVWLALLAITLQALVPIVQASMAGVGAYGERVAVCTAQGLVWSDVDGSAPFGGDAPDPRHCPFCAGSMPPLAGPASGVGLVVGSTASATQIFKASPRAAYADAAPPPARGPPALS